jgi:D-lyxose ketol-isomerase
MKRSQINNAIDQAIKFFKKRNFPLPPFAYWTPLDWKNKGNDYDEIRECRLGWDVTDFGSGDFSKIGRTIFTLRNGNCGSTRYTKQYCQKVMYLVPGQKSAIHYHKSKTEDIINFGGGILSIRLWKVTNKRSLSDNSFQISIDGCFKKVDAGILIQLKSGESICITAEMYHQFWADARNGAVLSMEVSSVCDDISDNIWLGKAERFPHIIEDEPARYVLCNEYI